MLRRNKNLKIHVKATIICGELHKNLFKDATLKKLESDIEAITDIVRRYEGLFVLDCIISGKRIVLEEESKEIKLYCDVYTYGCRIEETWKISHNEELYSILKNLVLS